MAQDIASVRKALTIEQTADLLQVDRRTVRRWISSGRLAAYRVGPTLVRIHEADVLAMLHPIRPEGGVPG